MTHRPLNDSEIQALEAAGCSAADWALVQVDPAFDPARIARTRFSGAVRLGKFAAEVAFPGGAMRPTGVYDSALHNVAVGDDALVSRVAHLANYDIGARAVVSNVGLLAVEGETAFGNGIEIEVLNEGGGRELPICDRLGAQVAYLIVVYRHQPEMVERLRDIIRRYAESKKSDRGAIGENARIEDVVRIRNVAIGAHAQVAGATTLEEGTIAASAADPVRIGAGVTARGFIVLSGSRVEDGAILSDTFVGQGCRMGKQYSAENSAFFANCEGFHGEACSIFAGPYTVSHHKSTLMIAGLFSFYNAGSGTNQSNHMYKLGPLHQGILARGAKTGSFSYMLWPSRVGPFSVVVGKHMTNFDLDDLPFSYITAENEQTTVTPAMNLFTVGTRRDSAKWPDRDRRQGEERFDLIHFDLFSPYIMERVLRGMADLSQLYKNTPKEKKAVNYKGARMGRLMLRTSAKYYDMIVKIFLGDCVIDLLDATQADAAKAAQRIAELAEGRLERWVDLAGLLAPAPAVEALIAEIADGRIADLEALQARLGDIHAAYDDEKMRWFARALAARREEGIQGFGAEDIKSLIEDWAVSREKLNNIILQDAAKEFDATSHIGFGIDGDQAVREADFQAVRGDYDGNKFVAALREETEAVRRRAEEMLRRIG